MTVTVQSSNLSSLSPKLQVYSSSLSLVGQASATASLGATITVSARVCKPGQGYYFKVLAAGGAGTDRRLRLAGQLRLADAVADTAAQHSRRFTSERGRRHEQ